jgi:predicted DCC family thiol-disulfide oxidoreductase YuxK
MKMKKMANFIVLFDGVCNFCNGAVRFIIERDPKAQFQFASLQSHPAQALLKKLYFEQADLESIVLIEDSTIYTASTAALRIVKRLSGSWPLLYIFVLVPRPLRDWVYSIVARHRYRWFGRQDVCMVPTPNLRQRFLE